MYHFQVNCGHFPFHTYSCHQCQIVYKEIAALWKNLVSFFNGTAAILKWRFQVLHWVLKRAHTFHMLTYPSKIRYVCKEKHLQITRKLK